MSHAAVCSAGFHHLHGVHHVRRDPAGHDGGVWFSWYQSALLETHGFVQDCAAEPSGTHCQWCIRQVCSVLRMLTCITPNCHTAHCASGLHADSVPGSLLWSCYSAVHCNKISATANVTAGSLWSAVKCNKASATAHQAQTKLLTSPQNTELLAALYSCACASADCATQTAALVASSYKCAFCHWLAVQGGVLKEAGTWRCAGAVERQSHL